MRSWNRISVFLLSVMASITVVGCGGGKSASPPAAYTIGGSVFGLTGTGLVLQDNSGNNLTVSAKAASYVFTFSGSIPSSGAAYSITVFSDPSGQACTVSNPIGTATANVVNADVTCTSLATATYTISGSVTGLNGAGLILQDSLGINDDDLLPVDGNGSFTFVDPVASGGAFSVSVLTQPAGRNCAVANGSGTASANVTNVSVICVGEWAWMGGSNTVPAYSGLPGVYGTLGTAASTNNPGGRQQSLSWTDASGNAWLFGGYGYDSTGVGFGGQLNDLWKFDPKLGANGEWTWMGGSNITPPSTTFGAAGQPGVYGTQGTASPANVPGGREQMAHWIDASGNIWVFGGEGIDANGLTGELNDVWKFDPKLGANGEWTWMGGSSSVQPNFGGQSGIYGTLGAPASTNIPGGRYGSVSWIDASGNFWLFGGNGIDSTGTEGYLNDLWEYTLSATGDTGEWTWMGGDTTVGGNGGQAGVYGKLGTPASANMPGGRDAQVSWVDASGNLWLFGGIGYDGAGNFGYLNDLWKYTASTTGGAGEWTWMGGSGTVPTPYSGPPGVYGSLGTAAAANVPGGRFSAVSWTDASGNLWLFGGDGYDVNGLQGYLSDLWKYTPSASGDSGEWTWMGGSNSVGRGGGQVGIYGTLGVTSTNIPGGRFGATSWSDASGNLWLFGGDGYDSTGNQGDLNDLWEYKP